MVGHDARNFVFRKVERKMEFTEWMKIGIENGWCGPPVCYTHDGMPMSEKEDAQWADGDDSCLHIIRLYEDAEHKSEIEDAHSPSTWRNNYTL